MSDVKIEYKTLSDGFKSNKDKKLMKSTHRSFNSTRQLSKG